VLGGVTGDICQALPPPLLRSAAAASSFTRCVSRLPITCSALDACALRNLSVLARVAASLSSSRFRLKSKSLM